MTRKITFTTQYTRTPESIRDVSVVEFKEPSKVKESLSYAVDINTIYDSYCKSNKLPLNGNQPIYDENFVNYDNLIEAQQTVKEACEYFQGLPVEIRKQYGNSLEKFVKAIHSNDSFLQEKGVLKKIEKVEDTPLERPSVDLPIQSSTPVQTTVETPTITPETTA